MKVLMFQMIQIQAYLGSYIQLKLLYRVGELYNVLSLIQLH